jgi:hypothetical protein
LIITAQAELDYARRYQPENAEYHENILKRDEKLKNLEKQKIFELNEVDEARASLTRARSRQNAGKQSKGAAIKAQFEAKQLQEKQNRRRNEDDRRAAIMRKVENSNRSRDDKRDLVDIVNEATFAMDKSKADKKDRSKRERKGVGARHKSDYVDKWPVEMIQRFGPCIMYNQHKSMAERLFTEQPEKVAVLRVFDYLSFIYDKHYKEVGKKGKTTLWSSKSVSQATRQPKRYTRMPNIGCIFDENTPYDFWNFITGCEKNMPLTQEASIALKIWTMVFLCISGNKCADGVNLQYYVDSLNTKNMMAHAVSGTPAEWFDDWMTNASEIVDEAARKAEITRVRNLDLSQMPYCFQDVHYCLKAKAISNGEGYVLRPGLTRPRFIEKYNGRIYWLGVCVSDASKNIKHSFTHHVETTYTLKPSTKFRELFKTFQTCGPTEDFIKSSEWKECVKEVEFIPQIMWGNGMAEGPDLTLNDEEEGLNTWLKGPKGKEEEVMPSESELSDDDFSNNLSVSEEIEESGEENVLYSETSEEESVDSEPETEHAESKDLEDEEIFIPEQYDDPTSSGDSD